MKLFKKMIYRSKKGFTLVEMLIVLALLAILMSVAVPGIAGYARRIELMELDDSARAIFMAVQNKMTVMKQSGVDIAFEDLKDELSDAEYNEIKPTVMSSIPVSFQVPPDPSADPDAEPPVNKLSYIHSEQLKKLLQLDKQSFVTLSSIEGQLYKHNYVIEYDPATGRVFGVFYSEESDLSDYPIASNPDNYDRDFKTRLQANKLVGYYGGGEYTGEEVIPGGIVEPPELKVGNLEKLVVYVAVPEGCTSNELYFSLSISDKNDPSKTVTIVPYSSGSASNYYIKKGKIATIILDSLAPGCCSDNGQWYLKDRYFGGNKDLSDYVLERDFKGWVYNPGRVASFDPYVNGPDSWYDGKNYSDNKDDYVINPGSDISIDVTFYDKATGRLETNKVWEVNSYFDKLDGNTADIAAGRHLQNLANYVDDSLVGGGILTKTIDFSLSDGGYETWNSDITYKGNAAHPDLYNFKPVAGKYVSDSKFMPSFDGGSDKGYEVKYLRIDTRGETGYDATYTGFFTELYNSSAVKNIKFYCPVVKGGGQYTGVFFGKDSGGSNYSGLEVVNPIVEGPGYVGTLVGMKTGGGTFADNNITVEEVDDYFDNYSDNYAVRGHKGRIDWSDPRNDPYARFYVKGTTAESYAGGLVGRIEGVVQKSSAAVRVISEGYAGGLLGYSDSNIQKCHVGGHTYNGSFSDGHGGYLVNIDGKKGAGGLVGYMEGGAPTGCYTTCSVRKYAGRNTYDTFIGVSASKSAGNGAYAIGSLIDVDNGIVINQGSAWTGDFRADLEALIEYKDASAGNVTTCEAHPYDPSLSGKDYPYRVDSNTDLTYHTGDWPVYQSDFDGWGLFYWEKEGDEYRIKAGYIDESGVFKGDISTLCTEKDGNSITEYGYGYFYSRNITDVTVDGFVGEGINKGVADYASISAALKSAGLQGVIFEAKKTYQNNSTHGDLEFSFKGKNADGTDIDQKLIYNPDFCVIAGVYTDEYEIRSVKQLKYLSTDSSCMSKNFVLTHDANFEVTDPYNHHFESMTPIGTSGAPFTGTFDGRCYRIVNARLDASGAEAGVFGAVENANIKSVVVFNADFSGITLGDNGAMGGIVGRASGNSSITNCAFTGKIDVKTSGSNLAAGGIVGVAGDGIGNITLQNCEAVMHDPAAGPDLADMLVSAANGGGVVAAGGIAGLVYKAPVSDCYSGGRIGISGMESMTDSQKYIGGIIGTNNDFGSGTAIETYITNCYTYYQYSGADSSTIVHPIGSDRLEDGAADDVSYTNCHYLGGAYYMKDEDTIPGVRCHQASDGVSDGAAFRDYVVAYPLGGGFHAADVGYLDSLSVPKTFSLPAVITDGTFYYHYGKSPIEESDGVDPVKPSSDDKLFGVFYWEKEAKNGSESYKVKVCYYDSDGNYAGTVDTLCREKDGNSIVQSGYGYFVGKKSKKLDVLGFDGATEISNWHINDAVKNACGLESSNLYVRCYDYTYSDDATERSIKINSDNANFIGKEFRFVPGLFAVGRIDDAFLDYEVRTQQQLENISRKLDGVYTQSHDIICGGSIAPIGDDLTPFAGNYDGGTYRIQNLKVERSASYVGLFGRTNNATIKNIIVVDSEIKRVFGNDSANVGGIVGSAENNTTIENCAYTGKISASVKGAGSIGRIGGVAGNVVNSKITRCESAADINASDTGISDSGYIAVGGIAGGTAGTAMVEYSYSGGSVKTSKQMNSAYLSGIVGFAEGGTLSISDCYTHMNIPGVVDNISVHPIAQAKADVAALTMTNCHYIEGMKHYANTLVIEDEDSTNIIKHTSFDTLTAAELGAAGFGTASRTYRQGLTVSGNYPLPAVVRNVDEYGIMGELVHYGNWTAEVTPLVPETYGIFYWEKEGDKYSVRVRYVANGKISSAQSISFCTDMDGKAITDYGYGYVTGRAVAVDKVALSGNKYTEENADLSKTTKEKLDEALRGVGLSGFEFDWVCAASTEHKEVTVEFKYGEKPLTIKNANGAEVAVKAKYNPDFCGLALWTGDSEPVLGYEIRTVQQLSNIRYYANDGLSFTQTHDIKFDNNEKIEAIGNIDTPFNGKFNPVPSSGGYRIIKPKIEAAGSYAGLFGVAKGATINRVTVFNGVIEEELSAYTLKDTDENAIAIGAAGGIVGLAENTEISGCAFTGTISASAKENNENDSYAIGGIVGCAKPAKKLESCEAVATIKWTSKDEETADYSVSIGGIAGLADGEITVNSCYSGGSLSAEKLGEKASLGGIVGSNEAVKVDKCYSYAKLAADGDSMNPISNGGTMTNCFYLKGEDYYNGDVAEDSGITAAATLKELQEALREHFKAEKQYFAAAYNASLSGKQMYALAAVVRDKNGNYVHYGQRPADDDTIKYPVPPAEVYKITIEVNGKGTVTADCEEAEEGTVVTLHVNPKEEYVLTGLNVEGGANLSPNFAPEVSEYTFKMPKNNVTIKASFSRIDDSGIYNITVIKTDGGMVDCPKQGMRYNSIAFTVKPDSGYKVKSVEVMTSSGDKRDHWIDNGKHVFTMPDDDVTITVTFEELPRQITVSNAVNGSVVADKSEAFAGETVTITIKPNSGYKLSGLTLSAGSLNESVNEETLTYTFTMPKSDVTVSATFEKTQTGDTSVGDGEIDTSKLGIFRVAQYYDDDVGGNVTALGGQMYDGAWMGVNHDLGNNCGIVLNSNVDTDRVMIRYYSPWQESHKAKLKDSATIFSREVINRKIFGDSALWEFTFNGNCYDSNMLIDIIWINDDGSEVIVWTSKYGVSP